tara:strand:- start:413 stop:775 length:363 start_codon:yes stop_codon:yes gene_type:complete
MDEIASYLLEFGALGAFCAFLVWSHVKAEKRMDKAVEAFQQQINQINERNDQRESDLRDRYDTVISKQDTTKERIFVDVVARLTSQETKLDDCIKALNEGLAQMRQEVADLKVHVASKGA